MAEATQEQTGLGNYFIANYPPFSFWKGEYVPAALEVLEQPPRPGVPLGLYLHIPFCRKRCKFCYFRVYTDKNARDVEVYLKAIIKEVELYSQTPAVHGRRLHFVYFGGGTPSYLSAGQLESLVTAIKRHIPWDGVGEVTFECEPGTLQQPKLAALRQLGITRLSLGVENFDDHILEENGRAHRSMEVYRSWEWIKDLAFDQVNIDLIAGMVGETWDNWKVCIEKTIELSPDSVTIYQMELPFNTVYSKELLKNGELGTGNGEQRADGSTTERLSVVPRSPFPVPPLIADWPTKRAWVEYGFEELKKAGYQSSSGYTLVKDRARTKFIYRDGLWHGADLLGTGVASFGHISGVHVQNVDDWDHYVGTLEEGKLPLARALPVQPKELLIRELILQMKTGRLEVPYFRSKFGVDILDTFADAFGRHRAAGSLTTTPHEVTLTPAGLLQVDRLLPEFFLPEHRGARYT